MYKIFICILLFLSFLSANAQDVRARQSSGSILGNVLDQNTGKALPDANIQLTGLGDPRQNRLMVTDRNGSFDFEKIAPGYYRLSIDMMGYAST
ncbi:MAG: carboxypeptidase regulatory-like domain-containing protein, partial [Bacteroidota bacterium]|nr:carboxypeptidase regulatory-like domain-containing protein [Bacteroidota bacterium]